MTDELEQEEEKSALELAEEAGFSNEEIKDIFGEDTPPAEESPVPEVEAASETEEEEPAEEPAEETSTEEWTPPTKEEVDQLHRGRDAAFAERNELRQRLRALEEAQAQAQASKADPKDEAPEDEDEFQKLQRQINAIDERTGQMVQEREQEQKVAQLRSDIQGVVQFREQADDKYEEANPGFKEHLDHARSTAIQQLVQHQGLTQQQAHATVAIEEIKMARAAQLA